MEMPVGGTATIAIDGLSKCYSHVRALDALSLDIRRGEVLGLLGPNGSGKTTTIRLLVGLLRPTAGRATVGGFDCWRDSLDVRRLVSYLQGELRLFGSMTGLGVARAPVRPERRRRSRPRRGDRRADHEAGPPPPGADLLDGDEAEARAGAGLRRPGRHPDPGRADVGAGPVGPRGRARPGAGGAGARPDRDLLRPRAAGGRAGRRPRRDHAEGPADARRGHARPPQSEDAACPIRAGRVARPGPRSSS